jgi:predicted aspartyl protease
MGVTRVAVALLSPDLTRRETLDLVVDTGSVYTWVPEDVAVRLGHRPLRMWRIRTIEGREIERPVCDAPIEVAGLQGVTRIVFAKPGDLFVLGVTAMETLGLVVDPSTHSLRSEDATLALAVG